jgi:hypothetical protein
MQDIALLSVDCVLRMTADQSGAAGVSFKQSFAIIPAPVLAMFVSSQHIG